MNWQKVGRVYAPPEKAVKKGEQFMVRRTIVKMTGDRAFALFSDPRQALLAVVELQRQLSVAATSSGVALRVRSCVHVGEATLSRLRPT